MSTASSIARAVYPTALLLVLTVLGAACKKDRAARFAEGDEKGRLRKISENLEQAYASAPLPALHEPESLGERVEKWDDFRSCTVRTYVAKKRDADRRAREGRPRSLRHASIGDETVEECGVQLAVAKDDREICERLAADYLGPNGELPLPAARCWDTRARVFGLPDECPVLRLGGGQIGRNPECVAIARRDQSLCPYTDSPGRCRALLLNDTGPCRGPEGADDCLLAVEYWKGLIPVAFGPPLIDQAALDKAPLAATFTLRWPKGEHPTVRVEAPHFATGISWPVGKVKTVVPPASERFWGFDPPSEAAQITWNAGSPALKLAFTPGGAPNGVRPLAAPGPTAPAMLIAVWADEPSQFRRCQPGPLTGGQVRYDAGAAAPGSIVTGELSATRLTCSDGSELDVTATFRLVITDLR